MGVLVMAADPVFGRVPFVAAIRHAVEHWIEPEHEFAAPCVGRVGVVHEAVFEREGAHAWQLSQVSGQVGTDRGRELRDCVPLDTRFQDGQQLDRAVVVSGAAALLLLSERNAEIEVESLPSVETQGNVQPIRRSYSWTFASGAREAHRNVTSRLLRWTTPPSKVSAAAEQVGQPAV
jgi:hypothetical protein